MQKLTHYYHKWMNGYHANRRIITVVCLSVYKMTKFSNLSKLKLADSKINVAKKLKKEKRKCALPAFFSLTLYYIDTHFNASTTDCF